jgi:predicted Zn-dependent protease
LETCHKLDPYSDQITYYIEQLKKSKTDVPAGEKIKQALSQVQQAITRGQTNVAEQILDQILSFSGADAGTLIAVADDYLRLHDIAKSAQAMMRVTQGSLQMTQEQGQAAEQILDQLLNVSGTDASLVMTVANGYLRLHNMAKSEQAVLRLTEIHPDAAQAWYNLAAIQSFRGAVSDAVTSLKKSMDLNAAELAKNPKAINLREHLFQDPSFGPLRQTPAFQAAFGAKP